MTLESLIWFCWLNCLLENYRQMNSVVFVDFKHVIRGYQ